MDEHTPAEEEKDLLDLNEVMHAFGVSEWKNLGPPGPLESPANDGLRLLPSRQRSRTGAMHGKQCCRQRWSLSGLYVVCRSSIFTGTITLSTCALVPRASLLYFTGKPRAGRSVLSNLLMASSISVPLS